MKNLINFSKENFVFTGRVSKKGTFDNFRVYPQMIKLQSLTSNMFLIKLPIDQPDETKEISIQTSQTQRKSFPVKDKNVSHSYINESISETLRNDNIIVRKIKN